MNNPYEKYKDRPPEELAAAIDKMKNDREVQQFIRSGKLDAFAKSIRPMLGSNAAKLDDLLRRLKK